MYDEADVHWSSNCIVHVRLPYTTSFHLRRAIRYLNTHVNEFLLVSTYLTIAYCSICSGLFSISAVVSVLMWIACIYGTLGPRWSVVYCVQAPRRSNLTPSFSCGLSTYLTHHLHHSNIPPQVQCTKIRLTSSNYCRKRNILYHWTLQASSLS
jgi:hypothetical protein